MQGAEVVEIEEEGEMSIRNLGGLYTVAAFLGYERLGESPISMAYAACRMCDRWNGATWYG